MIFDWPDGSDFCPINGSFRLMPVSHTSASPYTGSIKAINLAQIWMARFEIDLRNLANATDFQGFIDGLEGPTNPVRLFDRWRPFPRALLGEKSGFSDGTFFDDGTGFTDGWSPMVVTAASQGERRVHVEDLPASKECFRRGDLIGLGGYLYELRAGVTSNADGEALLNILPGLRANVAPGDRVTLWRPRVAMRFANSGDFEIARQGRNPVRVELNFVEDVP